MQGLERDVEEVCAFLHRYLSGERGFTSRDALAGIIRLGEMQAKLRDSERRKESQEIGRAVCEKLKVTGPAFDWTKA